MNFKIGETIVCVSPIDEIAKDEMYTIKEIHYVLGAFAFEIMEVDRYISFYNWRFRKLDYDFANNLLETIKEDMLCTEQ
jgi:hypothetical protein